MIEIETRTINSRAFHEAFARLSNCPSMTTLVGYKISKLKKELSNALDTTRECYVTKFTPFFEKDAEGKFIIENPNAAIPQKIIEDKKDKFEELLKEFMDTKIELESRKVFITEIPDNVLSPNDILALGPILAAEATMP